MLFEPFGVIRGTGSTTVVHQTGPVQKNDSFVNQTEALDYR